MAYKENKKKKVIVKTKNFPSKHNLATTYDKMYTNLNAQTIGIATQS